jgi:hypothetical protein
VTDQQLAAGIELLQAAHRAQIRALDLVWMMNPDEDAGKPALAASERPSAGTPAPAALRPRRRGAWELLDEVERALAQVGHEFDRNDICRALGYEPNRASLHRALLALEENGQIVRTTQGSGRTAGRFSKVSQEIAAAAEGPRDTATATGDTAADN